MFVPLMIKHRMVFPLMITHRINLGHLDTKPTDIWCVEEVSKKNPLARFLNLAFIGLTSLNGYMLWPRLQWAYIHLPPVWDVFVPEKQETRPKNNKMRCNAFVCHQLVCSLITFFVS